MLYRPYHQALGDLLAATRAKFGVAVLIDCHSMPSIGGPTDQDKGARRPDFVLGDRFGHACDRRLTDAAEAILRRAGYQVCCNNPYAGGYTTNRYGRPSNGVHGLQIEVNRALYMDEVAFRRLPGLDALAADLAELIRGLGELAAELTPCRG